MPTDREPGPQDRTAPPRSAVRLTARVSGRVQGVGFRAWTRRRAQALGLTGSATNLPDGDVEVVAEGARSAAELLLSDLRSGAAPGSVRCVTPIWEAPQGDAGVFREG